MQEWHEGFLNDCPSGELSPEEFERIYSQMFPTGNVGNFIKNVFRTIDTNNSGSIDFREFLLVVFINSSGSPDDKLARVFRMYDVDGSGTIDLKEVER